jgi:hypothetical protein
MGWISRQANFTFLGKVAAVVLLAGAADILFFMQRLPGPLGLFAMLWALLFAATVPALRGSPAALVAILAAFFYGFILFDDPNPLAVLLFLAAIGLAALLPRVQEVRQHSGLDTAPCASRISSPFAPVADGVRLQRAGRRRRRFRLTSAIALLAIPVGGSILFLSLFAAANPMIEQALEFIQLPDLGFDLFSECCLGRNYGSDLVDLPPPRACDESLFPHGAAGNPAAQHTGGDADALADRVQRRVRDPEPARHRLPVERGRGFRTG